MPWQQCTSRTQHQSASRMFNRCIDLLLCSWSLITGRMCGGALKDAIITQWDFKRSNSRTHSNRVRTSHHISSSVPRPVMQIWRQHIFQLKRWITRVITFLENLRCEYATGWSWASCSRHYTAPLYGGGVKTWQNSAANWFQPISQGEPLLHLGRAETLLECYTASLPKLHLDEMKALIKRTRVADIQNKRDGVFLRAGSQDNISTSSSTETDWDSPHCIKDHTRAGIVPITELFPSAAFVCDELLNRR